MGTELFALSSLIDQLAVLYDAIGHSIIALTAFEVVLRQVS